MSLVFVKKTTTRKLTSFWLCMSVHAHDFTFLYLANSGPVHDVVLEIFSNFHFLLLYFYIIEIWGMIFYLKY
ncbi:hypothetical protein BpHYR1_027261 [Brachionus plicatilis]|uniref:Uncharacterized protein n=1 Tax=Brachionus plicatilis TaxID=10195 RepID=A0A3M7S797_BRAPC|nr:hypothetical protein BpHYR1_027261 [Brachionus plicatilis]